MRSGQSRLSQSRARTLKAPHLEALMVRKFCDPWSVFSPSMAGFLKPHRQRLLCAQALVDRSFYVGQWLPWSSRLQFGDTGQMTRYTENADTCVRCP